MEELNWDNTVSVLGVSFLCAAEELDVFFSHVAVEDDLDCFNSSAVKSWDILDLRPALLKGLADADDAEREEKPELIRSSVFSLRSEPALCGPVEAGPFRGMVYLWVGGVLGTRGWPRLSPVGLEFFLAFSSCTLRAEGSGEVMLLVKDWDRFFLELSSKNSMTKA